ncbi:helix-turn-helix domain-containing protein [Paenibacillus sp. FA6]|uniref:helix-turn-helix domain-containing protein n=1 Tax=Paenibacillus sp. FA6 TaxID=3413029 RepID=UPI003F65DDA1
MEQISQEMIRCNIGYREAVRLIACQLLLHINRLILTSTRSQTEESRIGPSWMMEALREINEHPERQFGLVKLAEQANISPPHFSRVFRQWTTMNVTNYINAKRIIRAKEMLLQSEEIISVIADQCGFDTPTHFYRIFKNVTGVTPNAYRKGSS